MALKILVADDSIIFRKVIRDCLRDVSGVEVIGVAKDGEVAIQKIRQHRPDIVTLDYEMPQKNGLEVLEAIREDDFKPMTILLSSFADSGSQMIRQAILLGADEFILKPNHSDPDKNIAELQEQLRTKIEAFVDQRATEPHVCRIQHRAPETLSVLKQYEIPRSTEADVIAIGISTGGPKALSQMIPQVSQKLSIPIFIVQHMPANFTKGLADHLNNSSPLTVVEAQDGMLAEPGCVYIAPGGRQTRVSGYAGNVKIEVNDDAPVRACKPSVDYLFESIAKVYRSAAVGIIMTGMGNDGAVGCQEIANAKGRIWSQTESTCSVYGMPRAAVDTGLCEKILSLNEIAHAINSVRTRGSQKTISIDEVQSCHV